MRVGMAHWGGPLAAIVSGARQWQCSERSVGHHTGPAERFNPSSKSRIVSSVVDDHVFFWCLTVLRWMRHVDFFVDGGITQHEEFSPNAFKCLWALCLGHRSTCLLHDALASAPDRGDRFQVHRPLQVTSYIKGGWDWVRHAAVPDIVPGCLSVHAHRSGPSARGVPVHASMPPCGRAWERQWAPSREMEKCLQCKGTD